MEIEFVIRGTSSLLHHNPQMVDPECEWNRKIKALASKRKKTDEDLAEIGRLEWLGGIYTATIDGKGVISLPTSKLRKCLINAARIAKQGKQVERALIMTVVHTPLLYEGSDNATRLDDEIERLMSIPQFTSRLSVGIGQKRVMRVRPQFVNWAAVIKAMFITDAGLNFGELEAIIDLAGRAERLGDNRVNGYGAFVGVVREVTAKTPAIPASLAGVTKFIEQWQAEQEKAA